MTTYYTPPQAVPAPAPSMPPGVSDTGNKGSIPRYALEDHTHASRARKQRVTMGTAATTYTWIYPTPFEAGVVPIVSGIVQVPANNTDLFNVQVMGTPTNTQCTFQINRVSAASCQSTGSIDTAIQKNLPQICSAAATAHSAFVIVASTGNMKQATINKEAAAWGALEVVCRDPSSVTAATALVRAAEAYAAIKHSIDFRQEALPHRPAFELRALWHVVEPAQGADCSFAGRFTRFHQNPLYLPNARNVPDCTQVSSRGSQPSRDAALAINK